MDKLLVTGGQGVDEFFYAYTHDDSSGWLGEFATEQEAENACRPLLDQLKRTERMKIGTFRRIRMSDLMSNWKLWVAEMQDRADSMRAGGGDFLADVGVDDLRLIEELVGKSFDEWLEATGRRCDAAELVRVRILRADS